MNSPPAKRSLKSLKLTAHLHWHFMGMGFILCLSFAAAGSATVWLLLKMQQDLVSQLDPELARQLASEQGQLVWLFVAQMLLFLGGTFAVLILSAHRIAGPYLALKRTFNKIRHGDTSARLSFREYDKLKDVEVSFNNMMDVLTAAKEDVPTSTVPAPPQKTGSEGMTLLEILIVVFIIGLLATLAIPAFTKPRQNAQIKICQSNLRAINGAKDMWAMEQKKASTDTPDEVDLDDYLKGGVERMICPASGNANTFAEQYEMGTVGESATCKSQPLTHRL